LVELPGELLDDSAAGFEAVSAPVPDEGVGPGPVAAGTESSTMMVFHFVSGCFVALA
jgi:hypothetical protein